MVKAHNFEKLLPGHLASLWQGSHAKDIFASMWDMNMGLLCSPKIWYKKIGQILENPLISRFSKAFKISISNRIWWFLDIWENNFINKIFENWSTFSRKVQVLSPKVLSARCRRAKTKRYFSPKELHYRPRRSNATLKFTIVLTMYPDA